MRFLQNEVFQAFGMKMLLLISLWVWMLCAVSNPFGRNFLSPGAPGMSTQTSITHESYQQLEEEHESNGPEGSAGVPMQRISLLQFGLALAVLLGTAGWFAVSFREQKRTNG